VPLRDEKARRIVKAVLANMDNWTLRAGAIADHCPAGAKHDALSLQRDLMMAKLSLERLTGLGGDD